MLLYVIDALFYLIPIGAIVFFCVSLIRFISARRKNKRIPGSYSEKQMMTRFILMIVSSVIVGIMLVSAIALVLLLFAALAYM